MTPDISVCDAGHFLILNIQNWCYYEFMDRPIEPGLLGIFRYYTSVAMVYFAVMWVYAVISTGWTWTTQMQLLGNFAVYLGLWGYLSWEPFQQRLKSFYLPIALLAVTVFAMLGTLIYLVDPSQADVNTIITRSWLWLPVLFVPLVLIAWQYGFSAVLIFTIFTNGLELIVLLVVADRIDFETLTYIGVPFIRAFAFGMVGTIVNNLMETQRTQRAKLMEANARLAEYAGTLEQLAVSRERNRLAGELHDTVAHTLSGLAVNLEALKTVIPEKEAKAHQMLDHSLHTARFGLDETRRALKALRAGPLEELGLEKAISRLVKTASERAGIPIDWECPADLPTMPSMVEQALYRVAQEALENIVRHANASHASVQLRPSADQVHLRIKDDGVGISSDLSSQNEGFGLRGLRERAAAVGARLSVESHAGDGTEIHFSWERFNVH